MTTRKPCVNIPTATYSGKEQSPLHFGLSAEGYDLNTIMEGYDHMMWSVKMKNNRKVWVRHMTSNKMVHEEPVINIENHEASPPENNANQTIQSNQPHTEPEIIKAVVEEKKITPYNLFLTYRLHQLKEANTEKINNKELFNKVIVEWNDLKKNAKELERILVLAKEFSETHKKSTSTKSKKK